jgi:glycosyltransferase involved in cell wall biosynthesis
MMKIWFPLMRGWSGTDIFTERLASGLHQQGLKTEVTYFSSYFEFAPFVLKNVSAPSGTQIIHTNSWNGFAFKRTNIPLVVTEHHCVFDPDYLPYESLAQRLYHTMLIKEYEKASFRTASAITAISQYTALSLAKIFQITNAQVIYNWVDTSLFTPSKDFQPEHSSLFRLLYVGNLSRRKGSDLLKPIMNRLGPDFELHYTSGLRSPRNRLPECQNMHSVGTLKGQKLVQAYQRCNAFLFPSRFEGFGLAVLEAMACGKPVIASDNSALPEVIEKDVSGIICPTNDVNAFAEACLKLAHNPELCERYGYNARKRAVNFFSQDKAISRYRDIYHSLID